MEMMIQVSKFYCEIQINNENNNNFRPDGVGTVLFEEREKSQEIRQRLRLLLEYQITNFRWVLPLFYTFIIFFNVVLTFY